MEALAMASTSYDFLHKYLDDPKYTKPSSHTSTSPLELLRKISNDTRLDNLFTSKSPHNLTILFTEHESLVLEYWNAWTLTNPKEQFQESQDAAIALLINTVEVGTHSYDFFMVHLLTTSHAVRILLPMIPKKWHIPLVRQWWLLTIGVYLSQLRPKISKDLEPPPQMGKTWKYVEEMAVSGPWATDAHYVKGMLTIDELIGSY